MIALYLFLTAYPQKKINITEKESIWEMDLSKNLIPKTNSSIQIKNLTVPSIIVPSDVFDEIKMIIPYQYKVSLHGYLKHRIYQFFEEYLPKDLYKVESLLHQLEKYRPSEIDYFSKITSTTQKIEKMSEMLSYLPFSDHYNPFKYDPTDFKYAYTYKYSPIFESYHQFFECSQTGRSFLIKLYKDDDNQLFVTKISNSIETPGDTFFRTFENLKYIVNNFEEIEFKFEDPFQVMNKNYAEFLYSCEKLVKTDKENSEYVKNVRSEVSKAVIDFISISSKIVYKTVEIFGVNVPILMKSSTIVEDGMKSDCFYLTKDQALFAIEQLDDNVHFYQKVKNFFHTIFIIIICFLLKIFVSSKDFAAVLFLSSTLLNEVRKDDAFLSPVVDWAGTKINSLFGQTTVKQELRDEELKKIKRSEEINTKGRALVKNIIQNSIKGHDGPFVLKLEKSDQSSYRVASMFLFPKQL